MHTSTVTYHRLTFSSNNYADLATLANILGLQKTDHPAIFDLVQTEVLSITTVMDIIARISKAPMWWGYTTTKELVQYLNEVCSDIGYRPRTGLLHLHYYKDKDDVAITADELFDLITIVGSGSGIILDNIATEWVTYSNKVVAGSHCGGASIVTKDISIPVTMGLDAMETVTNDLSKIATEGNDALAAEYYVKTFISPLIDRRAIANDEYRALVMKALFSHLGRALSMQTPGTMIPSPTPPTEDYVEPQPDGICGMLDRFQDTLLDQLSKRDIDPYPTAIADIELYLLSEVLPAIIQTSNKMRGSKSNRLRGDDRAAFGGGWGVSRDRDRWNASSMDKNF